MVLDSATLGRIRNEEHGRKNLRVAAGVDLGGTAINYTLVDQQERFLIDGLCEHPALAKQGPDVCLGQIADGLKIACEKAGVRLAGVAGGRLHTPRPAPPRSPLTARRH